MIGRYLDSSGGDTGMYLQGYLDEFYIFDEVRDQSQVKKLMEKCEYPTDSKLIWFDLSFTNCQQVKKPDSIYIYVLSIFTHS